MEIVDARGQVCPRPIIMTKNVFDELEEGTVKTQVDDMYCVENLQNTLMVKVLNSVMKKLIMVLKLLL